MALNQPHDPLERATQALRDTREPGWIELSAAVMSRVKAVVTPAARILTTPGSGNQGQERQGNDDGSRTWISARVLTATLRRTLRSQHYAPSAIHLDLDDDRLTAVNIDLVCAYDTDLQANGHEVRSRTRQVLNELLGPHQASSNSIEITVADVVLGNPNLV